MTWGTQQKNENLGQNYLKFVIGFGMRFEFGINSPNELSSLVFFLFQLKKLGCDSYVVKFRFYKISGKKIVQTKNVVKMKSI